MPTRCRGLCRSLRCTAHRNPTTKPLSPSGTLTASMPVSPCITGTKASGTFTRPTHLPRKSQLRLDPLCPRPHNLIACSSRLSGNHDRRLWGRQPCEPWREVAWNTLSKARTLSCSPLPLSGLYCQAQHGASAAYPLFPRVLPLTLSIPQPASVICFSNNLSQTHMGSHACAHRKSLWYPEVVHDKNCNLCINMKA